MWNTRRYDADNGLYYYKYRHYAANIGRWPSRDPIEEKGGVNLYAFVGNDGINLWDKLGLRIAKPIWKLECGCRNQDGSITWRNHTDPHTGAQTTVQGDEEDVREDAALLCAGNDFYRLTPN